MRIYKILLYFEVSISLYTYKNDTLSFVTEAFVLIKLQFVTYNTYVHTHVTLEKSIKFCTWAHFLTYINDTLSFAS